MTEPERNETLRAVPILAGFLGTLLELAADDRASDDTIYTCPDATFEAAADICRRFLAAPGVVDMVGDVAYPPAVPAKWDSVGADLYLTIAGHGAGFWDGDWQPHGDALTEAAREAYKAHWLAGRAYPEGATLDYYSNRAADMFTLETYVGDDGHVYIC